jgi:hypothetical protein
MDSWAQISLCEKWRRELHHRGKQSTSPNSNAHLQHRNRRKMKKHDNTHPPKVHNSPGKKPQRY